MLLFVLKWYLPFVMRGGEQLLSYAWNLWGRIPENLSCWSLLGGEVADWEGDFTFCNFGILNHVNELPIKKIVKLWYFFFKKKEEKRKKKNQEYFPFFVDDAMLTQPGLWWDGISLHSPLLLYGLSQQPRSQRFLGNSCLEKLTTKPRFP